MDWQIICKKYMYICFEPNIFMMSDKGSAQTSLVTPSTYQEVLKVLSIVIRRGHILLLAQPCQHLLHISQVLMQLDRLLQFGPPSSREGLETRPLLVQLGLGMRHNNSQQWSNKSSQAHRNHTQIMCRSHANHVQVICKSHAGHMQITCRSHANHMRITCSVSNM